AKPNFKKLGPKLGSLMKQATGLIAGLNYEQIAQIIGGASVEVSLEGRAIELTAEDIEIVRQPKEGLAVSTEGSLVVGLDTALNTDLIQEGLAREFVNKVQSLRKEMDLEVTQRIEIRFYSDEEVKAAVEAHRAYIQSETLALSSVLVELSDTVEDRPLNGHPFRVELKPVSSDK
ncbi:MAG: isoleucine--tRNA ligase, partial [Kiritimatiellaceae bacterium]|nr:isoleucine--tRNA ligase [Kiritimatiellaceae bacterium]